MISIASAVAERNQSLLERKTAKSFWRQQRPIGRFIVRRRVFP
jgi:hypothetical protein